MFLTIEQIIEFVNNWKSSNGITGELSATQIAQFMSDLKIEIGKMNFTVPDGTNTVLYSGKSGSLQAWEIVENATQNSNGNLMYISDLDAGKLISDRSFIEAVTDVVGDKQARLILNGYDENWIRVSSNSIDDFVSATLVNSGKGGAFYFCS